MRAVLSCGVAVTFLATIRCSIVCNIQEYSQGALNDLYLSDPDCRETTAELVNPDTEIQFRERDEPEEDAVYMVPTSTPEKGSGLCANSIGIKLTETGDVFCNISIFGLEVDYLHTHNDEQTLQIALLFDSKAESETSFILDIPIFVQPLKFASDDKQEELKSWAAENKVGIVSPLDLKMLNDIRDKKPITLGFKWLSDLLGYGITKSSSTFFLERSEEALTGSYVARPIAVTKKVAQEFVAVVIALTDDLYFDLD